MDFNKTEKVKKRTKDFALMIIALYRMLPKTGEDQTGNFMQNYAL
ncbi:hypothetical protein [Rhodohalobacter sp. 614A]|nr:hypothetical protein [Rhodohalobacter sp. 614A]